MNVIGRNKESKDFLSAVSEEKTYVRDGLIFRKTAKGIEFLGPVYKAWKEL